jgi:2-keto-4-pentenoate hydratase/2-oxohepta-3-ene-1,7-dioic acid hydratase in catechol pathway
MLLARYVHRGLEACGIVEGEELRELACPPYEGLETTGTIISLREVSLLPPCRPEKIVAVGLNYGDHAAELNHPLPEEPVLFMKPVTTLLPDGGEIILPDASRRVDYEAELALVVKDTCHAVAAEEASAHILGYCCANDITARDLQVKDGQWTRAKSFDTFCPLGPWLALDLDPTDLRISLRLNGETRQSSRTSAMIFTPFELFSFISGIMTLNAGDVIITGTPPGVGEVAPGDDLEVEIEGIGVLHNHVACRGV